MPMMSDYAMLPDSRDSRITEGPRLPKPPQPRRRGSLEFYEWIVLLLFLGSLGLAVATSYELDPDNVGVKENVNFVLDALYGATNEPMGTSYRSRLTKEYVYAGKTGTSQIRTITAEERKLKLKQKDLPYERRDHALFLAFAPYKKP